MQTCKNNAAPSFIQIIFLQSKLLRLLPSKALIRKMAILSRPIINRIREIQLLDNDTRSQVKVLVNNLDEFLRRLVRGAVGLDEDGEGLCDANGVRELDEGAAGKAGLDERLGDPAGEVGG